MGAVLAATGGSASAAGLPLYSQSTTSYFSYMIIGKIPNAPGNAHSGYIVQSDGDGDAGELVDWNCLAGVTPPTYYNVGVPPVTTCTVLRAEYVGEGFPYTGYPNAGWKMRSVHAEGEHVDNQDALTGENIDTTVYSKYTMYGSGPTTTVVYTGPGYRTVDKTRAATRVSGHFAWINFNDPRTQISNGSFASSWEFSNIS